MNAGSPVLAAHPAGRGPKQAFLGKPTNACFVSFVFAEFFRKTGEATFAISA
jgi:hypothetical protein